MKCEASIGELNEYVTASALPEDAESMLQLVYMTFAQPRFDREVFGKMIAQQLMQSRMQGMNLLQDTVKRLQNGCHPRVLLKTRLISEKWTLTKSNRCTASASRTPEISRFSSRETSLRRN